ncbi:MAG TPA: FHA domain-containing protein, partial [Chloroflexota bacterium]|nr:FHA domain-containing protein [Chloroflexota bacterium]
PPGPPAPAPPAGGRPLDGPLPWLLVADRRDTLRPALALAPAGLSVGRQRENDLVLRHPQVSRRHLRVDWDGQRATVTDLGSGNGTWLGGVRLPHHVPQPWPPETDVTLGPFRLRLDPSGAPASAGESGQLPSAAGSLLDFPAVSLGAGGPAGLAGPPRLVVSDQEGRPQTTLDLAEGSLQVGRPPAGASAGASSQQAEAGQEGQVLLPDDTRKVSRQHARIDWDGQQATVTDLGSDNGTWLGEARLAPQTPTPWPPEEWLRIGPYWLRIEQPVAEDEPASNQLTAMGRVQMLLDQRAVILTPGQTEVVRGTVANLGTIVDHFHVSVEGVPRTWVSGDALRTGDNEKIQLNPSGQAPVALTVSPPRAPESRAGEYLVHVLAHSTQDAGEMGVAQASWTVLPFHACALHIDRGRIGARRRATFNLALQNLGNTPLRATLAATDEQRKLRFAMPQPGQALEPGQELTVPLTVSAPWYWLGAPRAWPFQVRLTPEEGDPPPAVGAELEQHSLIPAWMPRTAAGVVPLLLILAILLQSFIIGLLRPEVQDFSVSPPSNPAVQGQPVAVSWRVERAQKIIIEGLDGPGGAPSTPAGDAPAPTRTPLPPAGQLRLEGGLLKDQQFKLVASNIFGP